MKPDATPAALGYRMPAEWEEQEAVWLSWPSDPATWPDTFAAVEANFAEVASVLSRFEPVRINAYGEAHARILGHLRSAKADLSVIELFDHPNNDVWCRDHGPIFVRQETTGRLAVTDWRFNGWGDKFGPYDLDNEIPRLIAERFGFPRFEPGMILEGGAIEVNGGGRLLTTEAVLLNPNRNPELSREEIERRLREFLGVTEILWLARGIEGDDTDGHVDDLARFVSDTAVVAVMDRDPSSPNHAPLAENWERLRSFRQFDLIEMPMPVACEVPGWRLPILPASYVNFLIVNGGVVAPTFGQSKRDDQALAILRDCFPGREVVGVPALDIVREGGSIHCISQQQPKAKNPTREGTRTPTDRSTRS